MNSLCTFHLANLKSAKGIVKRNIIKWQSEYRKRGVGRASKKEYQRREHLNEAERRTRLNKTPHLINKPPSELCEHRQIKTSVELVNFRCEEKNT